MQIGIIEFANRTHSPFFSLAPIGGEGRGEGVLVTLQSIIVARGLSQHLQTI